jgi:hypothetical protein
MLSANRINLSICNEMMYYSIQPTVLGNTQFSSERIGTNRWNMRYAGHYYASTARTRHNYADMDLGTRAQHTVINCLFVTIESSNLDNYVVDESKVREFWHTIKVFYLTRVASL